MFFAVCIFYLPSYCDQNIGPTKLHRELNRESELVCKTWDLQRPPEVKSRTTDQNNIHINWSLCNYLNMSNLTDLRADSLLIYETIPG